MNTTPSGNQNGNVPKLDVKEMIRNRVTNPKKTFTEADRRKGGRPPLEPDQKVSKNRLTVYLTDAELEQITNAATEIGMKAQSFVKMTAFKYIKADPKEAS